MKKEPYMKTQIYVEDSYQTESIVKALRAKLGNSADVHDTKDEGQKFDFIFLSGKFILDYVQDASKLKEQHGNSGVQVVALSTMRENLEEIEDRPELGVDQTLIKDVFTVSRDKEGHIRPISDATEDDYVKLADILGLHEPA